MKKTNSRFSLNFKFISSWVLCSFVLTAAAPFNYAEPDPGALPTNYIAEVGNSSYSVDGAVATLVSQGGPTIGSHEDFNIGSAARFDAFIDTAHLNKVRSTNPSEIFGALNVYGGKFFLVNPNGIYFAPGASVNAAGLVASTLNIQDQDFLNAQYRFSQADSAPASILNEGHLVIGPQGLALLAGAVENKGLIEARESSVVLAGGKEMTLSFDPSGLVSVVVDKAVSEKVLGRDGSEVQNGVSNAASGIVRTSGGNVYMTAEASDGIFKNLVNQEGLVEAASTVNRNGTIELVSNHSAGIVSNTGTLSATGADGLSGGTVRVLGEKVYVGGKVDVSGESGGGTVLLGGNYQGGGSERTADWTIVASDALIKADALYKGMGGKVIVWANKANQFFGKIFARGGSLQGDGGFAEISSKESLVYRGEVNLSATSGEYGTLLFDPAAITIKGGTQDGTDDEGSSTSLFKEGNDNQVSFTEAVAADPFLVFESELEGTDANIILQATNGISVNGTFTSGLTLQNNRSITLSTRNSSGEGSTGIDLVTGATNFSITTQGTGNITIETGTNGGDSGSAPILLSALTTASGDITVSAEGALTVSGALTTGNSTSGTTGSINLTSSASSIAINADVRTGNSSVADSTGNQTAQSGNIDVSAKTSVTGTGRLITGNAAISGASAAGTDKAVSGDITVKAGVSGTTGGVNLSSVNALQIGTAQRTGGGAGSDTATAGTITLQAIDEINNGTASTALDLTIGAASGASTNNAGELQPTTSGANGNMFLSSASNLRVGALQTATGTQTVNLKTNSGANLTILTFTDQVQADTITLDASTGTLNLQNTSFNAGSGSLTLIGNEVNLSGGADSVQGTGSLTIKPSSSAQDVKVGAASDSGTGSLDILSTDLSAIQSGFSSLTLGQLTGTGKLTVTNAVTFDDSVSLLSASDLTVSAAVSTANVTTSGTASKNITLQSAQGDVIIDADVKTGTATVADVNGANSAVTGNLTVSAGKSVKGSGQLATGNASITGSSKTGPDTITSGNLSVTAGTAGVSGGIGLSNANALVTGSATRTGATEDTTASGAITLSSRDEINNGTASTPVQVTLGSATGGTSNTLGQLAATTTQSAGSVFITSSSLLNLGALTAAGAQISLTADQITLNGNVNVGSGVVALKQRTASRAIDLGTKTAGTLGLTDTELDKITAGVLRVGALSNSGAIQISAAISAAAYSALSLLTGGTITQTAGVTVGSLAVQSVGSATLTSANNNVSNLSANITGAGNAFSYTDADSFTVATVDGVSGINTAAASATNASALSGGVTLTTSSGSITVNQNIQTGNVTVNKTNTSATRTAASGSISLTSATGVTGSGRVITGDATFTGASELDADSATSGNIILNVTGAGDIGLSAANALTTGSASAALAGTADTTTGNISLTADRVNNGTVGSLLDVSMGSGNGGPHTQGVLNVTTDGAAGSAGEIRVTSGEALKIGVLVTAAGSAQDVQVSTTGAADLTVTDAAEILSGDALILDAGTGTLTLQDTNFNAGAGSLRLIANEINLSGGNNSLKGTGALTIQTASASQAMTIGGAADSGSSILDLLSTDLTAIQDGFSSITLGRTTDATGAVTLAGASNFNDDLTIVGGSIAANATLTSTGNAVTLTARTGGITDGNGAANNISASSATLSAVSGIGSADALETSLGSATFTNSTSGHVQITDADSLTISGSNTGTGSVTIITQGSGDLSVTNISNSTGAILLTSGGSILDNNGSSVNLQAQSVSLTAQTGIGAADALEIAFTSSDLTATTAQGDLRVSATSTGTLNVANLSVTGGAGSIEVKQTSTQTMKVQNASTVNGAITLSSAGNLEIAGPTVQSGNNGQITLAADSDSNSSGNLLIQTGATVNGGATFVNISGALISVLGTLLPNNASVAAAATTLSPTQIALNNLNSITSAIILQSSSNSSGGFFANLLTGGALNPQNLDSPKPLIDFSGISAESSVMVDEASLGQWLQAASPLPTPEPIFVPVQTQLEPAVAPIAAPTGPLALQSQPAPVASQNAPALQPVASRSSWIQTARNWLQQRIGQNPAPQNPALLRPVGGPLRQFEVEETKTSKDKKASTKK